MSAEERALDIFSQLVDSNVLTLFLLVVFASLLLGFAMLFVLYRIVVGSQKSQTSEQDMQRQLIGLYGGMQGAIDRFSANVSELGTTIKILFGNMGTAIQDVQAQSKRTEDRSIEVSGTVAVLSTNVTELRSSMVGVVSRMDALEEAMKGLPHDDALASLTEHITAEIGKAKLEILQRLPEPPPTEPASSAPAKRDNVLDMDGAKADATVDLPVTTESKRDVA